MGQDLVINEITSLERKLSLLIKEYRSLKENLQQLQKENSDLKSALGEKQEQLLGFQNKAKISKLVYNMRADESETAELKKKLDDYIREIDKCITHLSN